MQLMELLHKVLEKELSFVHKKRLDNLTLACATALKSNKLYLTGLGRDLDNENKVSSNIQKIDRLMSNKHLHAERNQFYQVMMNQLLKDNKEPWIHIDWSCVNSTTNLYVLRASLSMPGRSIVIYEECYPKKKENNHTVHKEFLNTLKKLLPRSTKPVIVTDAGFRALWFKHVLKLGWDFVGRLRNKNLVQLGQEANWQLSSTFFAQGTVTPTCLGAAKLTQDNQVPVKLVVYRAKKKDRQKLNKNKQRSCSGKSERYAKSSKEPWVLVTSMPLNKSLAELTVNIYRQRMRIEENIRDTKCPYYGLGLKRSLTRLPERMGILLLIAALSTFVAWLAGLLVTRQGEATSFQSHSAKRTDALSKVFLGREAFKKGINITIKEFEQILIVIRQLALQVKLESAF